MKIEKIDLNRFYQWGIDVNRFLCDLRQKVDPKQVIKTRGPNVLCCTCYMYGTVTYLLPYDTVPCRYRTLPTNKNLRTVPYRTVPYLYLISSYRLSVGTVWYGRTVRYSRYIQYHTALYGNDVPYRAKIRESDSLGGTVKYGTVRYRTCAKLFRINV